MRLCLVKRSGAQAGELNPYTPVTVDQGYDLRIARAVAAELGAR